MTDGTGRVFYGWYIVAVCWVVNFVVFGISVNTFTVYVKPIQADLGWSRGEISLAISLAAVAMGLGAPFIGRLIDRIGARLAMAAGAAVIGVCTILLSRGAVAPLLLRDLHRLRHRPGSGDDHPGLHGDLQLVHRDARKGARHCDDGHRTRRDGDGSGEHLDRHQLGLAHLLHDHGLHHPADGAAESAPDSHSPLRQGSAARRRSGRSGGARLGPGADRGRGREDAGLLDDRSHDGAGGPGGDGRGRAPDALPDGHRAYGIQGEPDHRHHLRHDLPREDQSGLHRRPLGRAAGGGSGLRPDPDRNRCS